MHANVRMSSKLTVKVGQILCVNQVLLYFVLSVARHLIVQIENHWKYARMNMKYAVNVLIWWKQEEWKVVSSSYCVLYAREIFWQICHRRMKKCWIFWRRKGRLYKHCRMIVKSCMYFRVFTCRNCMSLSERRARMRVRRVRSGQSIS